MATKKETIEVNGKTYEYTTKEIDGVTYAVVPVTFREKTTDLIVPIYYSDTPLEAVVKIQTGDEIGGFLDTLEPSSREALMALRPTVRDFMDEIVPVFMEVSGQGE